MVTYLELCFHLRNSVMVQYIWEEKYEIIKKMQVEMKCLILIFLGEDSFSTQMAELSSKKGRAFW